MSGPQDHSDSFPDGLQLRLLGPVEVWRDGKQVQLGRYGRIPTLVAALAMSANRVVSVDSLAGRIWGSQFPVHPRASLQSAVHRLRAVLGVGVVETASGGYVLQADPDRIDLVRFDGLVSRARAAAAVGTDLDALRALDEALCLWREPLLGNVNSDVLRNELTPLLAERQLSAFEERNELLLRLGQHGRVLAQTPPLVAQHPFRERLVSHLMLALYRAGRQADALAAYDRLRDLLGPELGIDPSQEVRDLHLSILRADPALALDLGRMNEPAAGMTAAPAPSQDLARAAYAGTPHQLPVTAGTLRGREGELRELSDWVADASAPRIVAVVGPGGYGKTSLAAHWARDIREMFPDGELYIDLRGYGTDPPLTTAVALKRLLHSLAVDPAHIPVSTDERAALLRSALHGRRMILLLDNASDTDQVRLLLPGSDCLVIVTSRSQLRGLVAREGARRVVLGKLDDETARALLADAANLPVRTLPEPITAELIELCAGLPLAIRIAGERAARDGADVPAVVAGLREDAARLDLLDSGDDLASLRTVFGWSYWRLEPATARAFRLLGSHPGPDIGAAAAAVLIGASPSVTAQLTDRLVDVHLVEQPCRGRFKLHDLLRVYARELSENNDSDVAAIRRLADWYLLTAAAARQTMAPRSVHCEINLPDSEIATIEFADEKSALDWFGHEHHALMAMLEYAFKNECDDQVWKLAWALSEFFEWRSHLDSWQLSHEMGQAAARHAGSGIGQMYMLHGTGQLNRLRGQLNEALSLCEAALRFARAEGARHREAAILNSLGVICNALNMRERAHQYYIQSLRICTEIDEPSGQVIVQGNLAELMNSQEKYEEAISYLEAATGLATPTKEGQPAADGLGKTLSELIDIMGISYAGLGEHDRAIEFFRRAFARNQRYGREARAGRNLLHLGDSLAAVGDKRGALEQWKWSFDIFSKLNIPDQAAAHSRIISAQAVVSFREHAMLCW